MQRAERNFCRFQFLFNFCTKWRGGEGWQEEVALPTEGSSSTALLCCTSAFFSEALFRTFSTVLYCTCICIDLQCIELHSVFQQRASPQLSALLHSAAFFSHFSPLCCAALALAFFSEAFFALFSTVLQCTAMHCLALHYIALHFAFQQWASPPSTFAWPSFPHCCCKSLEALFCTALYCLLLFCTKKHIQLASLSKLRNLLGNGFWFILCNI